MRLDGKIPIRSLNEVPVSDSPDLMRHPFLPGDTWAQMFDHRVREHYIEGAVAEPTQIPRISDHAGESTARYMLLDEIQQRNAGVPECVEAHHSPEVLGPTDIEDFRHRLLRFLQQREEEREPSPPHSCGEGNRVPVVAKNFQQRHESTAGCSANK
jgi:hypothetical protein